MRSEASAVDALLIVEAAAVDEHGRLHREDAGLLLEGFPQRLVQRPQAEILRVNLRRSVVRAKPRVL